MKRPRLVLPSSQIHEKVARSKPPKLTKSTKKKPTTKHKSTTIEQVCLISVIVLMCTVIFIIITDDRRGRPYIYTDVKTDARTALIFQSLHVLYTAEV